MLTRLQHGVLCSPLACLALACVTLDPVSVRPTTVGRPWAPTFRTPAVLIADHVRIEGPETLFGHVAVLQDARTTVTKLETTSDGLRQISAAKPGQEARIQAQLDALEIVALARIEVLQRPGRDVPVIVRAGGNVYWSTSDGRHEKRAEVLVLRGDPE